MSETGRLITELQVHGLRATPAEGNRGRRGGAGPYDHRELTIDGTTVIVPVQNDASSRSAYALEWSPSGELLLSGPALPLAETVKTTAEPAFYSLKTSEGIPYNSIALLHSRDVLATTLLQTCVRFRDRSQSLSLIHI